MNDLNLRGKALRETWMQTVSYWRRHGNSEQLDAYKQRLHWLNSISETAWNQLTPSMVNELGNPTQGYGTLTEFKKFAALYIPLATVPEPPSNFKACVFNDGTHETPILLIKNPADFMLPTDQQGQNAQLVFLVSSLDNEEVSRYAASGSNTNEFNNLEDTLIQLPSNDDFTLSVIYAHFSTASNNPDAFSNSVVILIEDFAMGFRTSEDVIKYFEEDHYAPFVPIADLTANPEQQAVEGEGTTEPGDAVKEQLDNVENNVQGP